MLYIRYPDAATVFFRMFAVQSAAASFGLAIAQKDGTGAQGRERFRPKPGLSCSPDKLAAPRKALSRSSSPVVVS